MKIDTTTPIEIDSNYMNQQPDELGAFSGCQDDREEKICPKCGELESECDCAYFDQLEAEELEAIEEDKKRVFINN